MIEKMEKIVWYIYIKNWKIMWSDKTWKNVCLWNPFEITLPWFYRMIDWVPKLIVLKEDLKPWDTFVWNRDFEWYYQKRIETVWWEKLEDTRVHDELKEAETDENPTPENHSESA